MERQLTYQDFDLLMEPGAGDHYQARVLRSPAGESGPVQFTLPFSPVELENFVLKVNRGRRRTRGAGRPETALLKEFGGKLYDAVFQDELREVLLLSLSLRTPDIGLRLRLRLTGTPELAGLPWEFLYDKRHARFLAQSRRSPLVRYLELPDPPQPLSVDGPLRLLVMISSPSDYPELDVEQEWSLLSGALAVQQEEGRVVIDRLAANMNELRRRLRRQQFHLFHFIGHGRYRSDWESGVLVMEDSHRRSCDITGDELGGLLTEYDETRLAVLNACEGARSDDVGDAFAGMAQSLIRQGLPAVVAMQFEISDDAAIAFAQELYAAIADGFPLEAAVAEARGAIRERNPTEWGTPVLYSRAPDGRLFDMTRQAREHAAHQPREQATERQPQTPEAVSARMPSQDAPPVRPGAPNAGNARPEPGQGHAAGGQGIQPGDQRAGLPAHDRLHVTAMSPILPGDADLLRSARSAEEANRIMENIMSDAQRNQADRWQILRDTQTKIFEIQQDVTVNQAKTADRMYNKWDQYISDCAEAPQHAGGDQDARPEQGQGHDAGDIGAE